MRWICNNHLACYANGNVALACYAEDVKCWLACYAVKELCLARANVGLPCLSFLSMLCKDIKHIWHVMPNKYISSMLCRNTYMLPGMLCPTNIFLACYAKRTIYYLACYAHWLHFWHIMQKLTHMPTNVTFPAFNTHQQQTIWLHMWCTIIIFLICYVGRQ